MICVVWKSRVQAPECCVHFPLENHFPVGVPSQKTIWPEIFGIKGEYRVPLKLLLQQFCRGLLNQDVFRVVLAGHLSSTMVHL